MLEIIRAICALTCAVLGIAMVFPLMPWAALVARYEFAPGWPVAPWLVAGCLALAAWVLPKTIDTRQAWPKTRAFYLGIGALCLMHPLIHLFILAWAGWRPSPMSIEFIWPALPAEWDVGRWLYMLMVYVALPAVCEEWFFRGRLLPWLRGKLGIVSAVSLSSLWFAAVHGNILAICVALPIGIMLALLYHKTGSLYACIAVHACHNFLMLGLGGLLVARPDLALILFALGTWMVISVCSRTLLHTQRQRLLTVLVVPLVVLAVHAGYRMGHLELWLWGAKRHLYQVPTGSLMPRLYAASRTQVLTEKRGMSLANSLLERPQHKNSNWWWLLAATDPHTAAQYALSQEDGAYHLLRELSTYPDANPRLQACAAMISSASYSTLYEIANEDHEALALLLPVAHYNTLLVSILERLDSRHRASMYGAYRLAYGKHHAAQLYISIHPDRVGPRDVYALKRHYPQAQELIDELKESAPERHAAWTLKQWR